MLFIFNLLNDLNEKGGQWSILLNDCLLHAPGSQEFLEFELIWLYF